jgi:hypothetical protein
MSRFATKTATFVPAGTFFPAAGLDLKTLRCEREAFRPLIERLGS